MVFPPKDRADVESPERERHYIIGAAGIESGELKRVFPSTAGATGRIAGMMRPIARGSGSG
jgi:hypothetical protein